jgi:hypothetical protein
MASSFQAETDDIATPVTASAGGSHGAFGALLAQR